MLYDPLKTLLIRMLYKYSTLYFTVSWKRMGLFSIYAKPIVAKQNERWRPIEKIEKLLSYKWIILPLPV